MARNKDVILVTGASGHQGGAVARELLGRGHRVRAMTRKPDSDAAQVLAGLGAEIVKGDLDDAESLKRAIQGAWGVFAVQNTWEAGVEGEEAQGKRIAEIARKNGVQHYVYTSVACAHHARDGEHPQQGRRPDDRLPAAPHSGDPQVQRGLRDHAGMVRSRGLRRRHRGKREEIRHQAHYAWRVGREREGGLGNRPGGGGADAVSLGSLLRRRHTTTTRGLPMTKRTTALGIAIAVSLGTAARPPTAGMSPIIGPSI